MNRGSKKDAVPAFASRVASSSQTLPTMALSHAVAAYGVGAGDSAGDGEGISTEPSVFGGFLFAALCRFGDGVGVALAAAGAVVVAVVPCCVQEAIHAMPMMAPSKHNTYLFIGSQFTSRTAKAQAIYLHDAPLDPWCTGEDLCRHAIERFSYRGGTGRR